MIDDRQERIRAQLRERVARGDRLSFERLYADAGFDPSCVPWADLAPDRNITAWLDGENVRGAGTAALVVGCGLGDDAEELSRRGFAVTAFDISPTAIEWCRRRFPDTRVQYQPADLLALPRPWSGSFDFVLEAFTLQTIPADARGEAIRAVAGLVAPGGRLLILCRARGESDPPGDLPFPLLRAELDVFKDLGLCEIKFEDFMDADEDPPVRRFRASYVRPE